ncbi:MAG: response regulator [Isosphaeraceae bacterium]
MAKSSKSKKPVVSATSPNKKPSPKGRKGGDKVFMQNDELYRLFVDSIKDYAILMLDPTGHVLSWNPGAELLKGYHADEIIGKHFSIFYLREDVEHGKPEMELRVATNENRFEDEGWRVRKDGSRFWASVIFTALRDETQRLVGFGKITRDLTGRWQAEETLRSQVQLLDLASDSVMIRDLDDRIVYWNKGSERLYGWKKEHVLGQVVYTFLQTEFPRPKAEILETFLREGRWEGELIVARRRVESRTSELEAIREFLGRWKTERRRCDRALRTLKRAENGGRSGLPSMAGTGDGKLLPRPAAVVLGQIDDNLRRLEKDLERFAMVLTSDGRQLDQVADLLDDAVRRLRMLPFAEACQGLDRLVRDLARASGKEVVLLVEGGQVELDRSILEGLRDPLYHLVRNAVDHGIETPDQRQAAGKLAQGRITLAAALRGTQVEVVVADDGRGLDLEAVRQQVRQQGLGEPPDERDLASCIFLPGFSTASLITRVSGRGVGLDVVKSQVELLHGTIDLSFTAGQGTWFALAVPLTLTTLRALLVEAGEQTFAWASTNVQRLVRIGPDDIRMVGGREMLVNGKSLLPMASLAETLGLPATTAAGAGGKRPGLIVAAAERRMVFVVDELIAEQEIVVKGLGDRIRRVRNFSGATILPSGRIALVLNAAALIRAAMSRSVGPTPAPVPAMTGSLARKRLLVVDDSVTTRSLEKSILEAAGYEVVTAADGEAGWKLLQERDVDLVITDIEMPRMDGFELTEAIRRSKRSHELPVILISARSSDRDKARGIEVGADAYIVKSTFDQKELLEALGQLL